VARGEWPLAHADLDARHPSGTCVEMTIAGRPVRFAINPNTAPTIFKPGSRQPHASSRERPRHPRAAPSRDARYSVSPKRPPARPAWGAPRKTRHHPHRPWPERQAHRPPQRPWRFKQPSQSRRGLAMRGASISPRESEGVAEGEDEDDEGEVRSEGSGPQSQPRASRAHDATGV
jgi:hypothetical protein